MKKSMLVGFLFLLLGFLCIYGYQEANTNQKKKDAVSKEAEVQKKQVETNIPTKNYIQKRRDQILQEIISDEMSAYEKVKSIHDYLVVTASYEEPIGLNAWILYGDEKQIAPTFLEKRASSILLYGFGYCEDYAAAMAVLLDGANIPVRYIAGLGYAQGRFMDHAWNQVELDGIWYHLDVTFDDSWSQRGAIHYDYFLKSDATMHATHRYGQSLLAMNILNQQQTALIRDEFMGEDCTQDYPPTKPLAYVPTRQDKEAIRQQLTQDAVQYEQVHGAIDPQRYDATPPVFGNEGYNRP